MITKKNSSLKVHHPLHAPLTHLVSTWATSVGHRLALWFIWDERIAQTLDHGSPLSHAHPQFHHRMHRQSIDHGNKKMKNYLLKLFLMKFFEWKRWNLFHVRIFCPLFLITWEAFICIGNEVSCDCNSFFGFAPSTFLAHRHEISWSTHFLYPRTMRSTKRFFLH